jgi:hypothetical protein
MAPAVQVIQQEKTRMDESTIKALGKVLKEELRLPEDLPFPIKRALQALAELPEDNQSAETPQKAGNGQEQAAGSQPTNPQPYVQ